MTQPLLLDRYRLLLALIFLVLTVLIAGIIGLRIFSDPGLVQAATMVRAAHAIDQYYPEPVNWERLTEAARNAIFDQLDQYSSFVSHRRFDLLDEEQDGGYSGIGVQVVEHPEGLLVMSVREDGPAAEAGITTGDIIVGVDSMSLAGLSVAESTDLVRGEEGTPVRLDIVRRASTDTVHLSVERRSLPFIHVAYAGYTADSAAYIRLLDFNAGASDDVRAALDSLGVSQRAGVTGVILDLRGNPGGLLQEALSVAELFVEPGQFLVGTDGRSRWSDQAFYSNGGDQTGGKPIVVLVDRGSASAAEIVAGALRQNGRAELVGDTTFGKGLVQGYVRYPDGDGMRLTVSRYYFEGPVYLNDLDSTLNDVGHGLAPDHYLPADLDSPVLRSIVFADAFRDFAIEHADSIAAEFEHTGELSSGWLLPLGDALARDSFSFASPRTAAAVQLVEVARSDDAPEGTLAVAERLLRESQALDETSWLFDTAAIKDRLIESAIQQCRGDAARYRQFLIREHPAIIFASDLLKDKSRD